MKVFELTEFLNDNPNSTIQFVLPNDEVIPDHFHVTEVGRVQRDFIDCGGTKRSTTNCLLQTWLAQDEHHRLDTSKLAHILKIAEPILKSTDLPAEVEYEGNLVSQFPILSAEKNSSGIIFRLGSKHTDCLARENCGVDSSCAPTKNSCGTGTSCC